jgi:hypothetical protein
MIAAIKKLKRLGAMAPRELAHRLREKGTSELERLGIGLDEWEIPQGTPFKRYLSGTPAQRFYTGNPERLRQWVQENHPRWIDRAVEEAERLCSQEIYNLGSGPLALGDQIDWHRDPLTRKIWERQFRTANRPEHDTEGRDSNNVPEMKRQQQ